MRMMGSSQPPLSRAIPWQYWAIQTTINFFAHQTDPENLMITTESKRRRVKVVFRSEEPIKLTRGPSARKFVGLVKMIRPAGITAKLAALDQLIMIARDLQFTRKLEAKRPSRPDANFTLRVLARMALQLVATIEGLAEKEVARIDQCFDVSCLGPYEPGVAAIEGVALVLHELATSAYVANHPIANPTALPLEHCSAIEGLQNQAELAAMRISCLPQHAEWALILLQQYIGLFPDNEQTRSQLESVSSILRNLALLAEAAYRIEITERGSQKDTGQFLAVCRLGRLYEQVTGVPLSHTAKAGRHYKGRPQSPFGRFVTAFMVIADPNAINRRGTPEAIAFVAWPKRASARKKAIRNRQLARHHKILRILSNLGLL
jgi:hypothetical protein